MHLDIGIPALDGGRAAVVDLDAAIGKRAESFFDERGRGERVVKGDAGFCTAEAFAE